MLSHLMDRVEMPRFLLLEPDLYIESFLEVVVSGAYEVDIDDFSFV